jgi:hypothetical protein
LRHGGPNLTAIPGFLGFFSAQRVHVGRLAGTLKVVGFSSSLPCILAAALAVSGCATQTVNLQEGPREYVATDYENVLRVWTRTEHLIALAELENFLTATATFESWDFRWAYVKRYVQDYRLTIDQQKKLLEKALEETRQKHQFFVAIHGGERKYNDLTKTDSAWIVRLIDDTGNETAPEDIVSIGRPNALERTYFPYNTVWRLAFRIRFPRVMPDGRPTISPSAKWFGLRFTGAQGNSELIWHLEGADGAQDKPADPPPAPAPVDDSIAAGD